jgi:hypothetical protein
MSRNDITNSIRTQMLRPTDIAGPCSVNSKLVAAAIAAWEIRRGLGVGSRSFNGENNRLKREMELARQRRADSFNQEALKADEQDMRLKFRTAAQVRADKLARSRKRTAKKAAARLSDPKYWAAVMAHPERYNAWTIAKVRVAAALARGGETAAEAEREKLRHESDARAGAKRAKRNSRQRELRALAKK